MKSSIKVTYNIQVGPYDMRLTEEEAESLFDQLQEILGKKKIGEPIPNWPYPEPAPTTPIRPYPHPWDTPTAPPWTYTSYPFYPQIWCGQSMFPKEGPHITSENTQLK